VDNPLWDYSVAVYGAPEIAPACLALQDRCGADVNLLLYAAWLAGSDLRLDAEHLEAVDCAVAEWRSRVVAPLRDLRRSLRGLEAAQPLRDDIKALELRAERAQQDLIYRCHRAAATLPAQRRPFADNLATVLRRAGAEPAQWRADAARLARALASLRGVAPAQGG